MITASELGKLTARVKMAEERASITPMAPPPRQAMPKTPMPFWMLPINAIAQQVSKQRPHSLDLPQHSPTYGAKNIGKHYYPSHDPHQFAVDGLLLDKPGSLNDFAQVGIARNRHGTEADMLKYNPYARGYVPFKDLGSSGPQMRAPLPTKEDLFMPQWQANNGRLQRGTDKNQGKFFQTPELPDIGPFGKIENKAMRNGTYPE
jgi:hypothetical protein